MKFSSLLLIFSLISLALAAGNVIVTPKDYWNSVLPNNPMPEALKNLLNNAVWVKEKSTYEDGIDKGSLITQLAQDKPLSDFAVHIYHDAFKQLAEDKQSYDFAVHIYHGSFNQHLNNNPMTKVVFLEKDIRQGAELEIFFAKTNKTRKTILLSPQVANSIPFSSDKLPQIYKSFSLDPNSVEANVMKETITQCEATKIKGEEKQCATSLESMVDFATSTLGKKVKAISTKSFNNSSAVLQKYTIKGVTELGSDKGQVICHQENYPYFVFYCHKLVKTVPYMVSLVGEDSAKMNALAVCHRDTSHWNPKHLAFKVLNVEPGHNVPICHFLRNSDVLWVPY